MVLIAHPSENANFSPEAPPVDSKAITRESIESPEFSIAGAPQTDSDELRLMPDDEVSFQSLGENAGTDFSSDRQRAASGTLPPPPPVNWNLPDRASPSQDWTSHGTNRHRQLLLIVAIGLTSILVTAGLFALFLQWAGRSGPASENSVAVHGGQEPSGAENAAQEIQTDGSDIEVSNSDQGLTPSSESTEITPPENRESLEDTTQRQPEADDDLGTANNPPSVEVLPESAPSESDVVNENENDELDASVGQTEPSEALPGRLKELAQLIGQPFEFVIPQTLAVPDKAPVTAEELGIAAAVNSGPLPRVDLHAASNERRIRGLRLDEMPLAHAINYLSVASGLPIVVDANSMMLADSNRSQKVSIRLDDGTAAECVDQFAQKVGLQVQSVDNLFFRLHAKRPERESLGLQYNIGDLIKGEADREWVRTYLSQFFPQLMEGVSYEDSTLRFQPEKADLANWFQLIRTMENWRTQKGLPSELTSYSQANLQVPLTLHSEVQGLNTALSQVVTGPRSLGVLLSSVSAQVGIECWVDWPALTRLGLEADTLIATVTFQRTLKGILDELSFEYGLVTAIIDEKTIWITSSQSYRAAPDIFVVPNENRGIEYWEQFVRPLTPALDSGVSKTELLLTVDGEYVFLKCCRPTIDFN